jgi:UDP-N-acetylmuramoyl-L-alanyl-D-glutamate--2,6-diaminopimelate ligase
VETPSEGIEQYRHRWIDYDFLVFTVLYPERLAIHNWDPEQCTQKMLDLFAGLARQKSKTFRGKTVAKTIIVNRDSDQWEKFWNNKADKKISFGIKNNADFSAGGIVAASDGVDFSCLGKKYRLNIPGEYNVANALPSLAVCRALDISEEIAFRGLASLSLVPGRMEKIDAGQFFDVYVDYAHDAPSMEALLRATHQMKKLGGRIIVAVGAEGGGRDKTKRPVMGRLCAELADFVVVTDVDPYDDDPAEIRNEIAAEVVGNGKTEGENLFIIADRREGIRQCLNLANDGDLVVITGKGAEQSMEIKGQSIPWDDRTIVREELKRIISAK